MTTLRNVVSCLALATFHSNTALASSASIILERVYGVTSSSSDLYSAATSASIAAAASFGCGQGSGGAICYICTRSVD